MRPIDRFEYPEEVERIYRKARRLEWITIAYIISAAIALYMTMGSSQAMRTSFFEDVISIVPAIAFLVGTAVARKGPAKDFPYGRHRATGIAHLAAALALCGMGAFLLWEAVTGYVWREKPTIGGFDLFGEMVWGGWPMLAALVYTAVPSVILGRMKAKLAPKLHDKVLFADSRMMKADWMAETATAVGVIGVGFGYWWVDFLAAGLVSADILHDGVKTLKVATADLIDRSPERVDQKGPDPTPGEVEALLRGLGWVEAAEVRMREEGHVFMGEAFVVPREGTDDLPGRIAAAVDAAQGVNWRMHDLVIQPVARLDPR